MWFQMKGHMLGMGWVPEVGVIMPAPLAGRAGKEGRAGREGSLGKPASIGKGWPSPGLKLGISILDDVESAFMRAVSSVVCFLLLLGTSRCCCC